MALSEVVQSLTSSGFEPHLEETIDHRVVGIVVSDQFQTDKTPRDRSQRIWNVLRQSLRPELLLQIGVLLPMTKSEYQKQVPA